MTPEAGPRERAGSEFSRALRCALVCAPLAAGAVLAGLSLFAVAREGDVLREIWGARYSNVALMLAAAGALSLLALALSLRDFARGRTANLARLRLAFVALALGWITYAVLLQPYWRLRVTITLASFLGAFALAHLVAEARRARAPSKPARAADFALFQLCLVVLLAELGLRVYGNATGSALLDAGTLGAERTIAHRREVPGMLRLGFPCDSRGYYDEEPSLPPREAPFIVCISDSFGPGVVPHALHFTTVAERILGDVEVYNMGVVSIGPREYLLLLRHEALPLEPDLVVVALFVGNDIEAEQALERPDRLLRSWFRREELRLYLLPQRLLELRAERRERRQNALAGDRIGGMPGESLLEDGKPYSLAELEETLPWLVDPRLEPPSFSSERFFDLELSRARAACRPGASYTAFLRRMDEIARAAAGRRLALMVIPDEFQVEDGLWEEIVAVAEGESLERFRPQREIGAFAEARGIPCLDLLPALRAVEPMEDGRRRLYHLRDTHFNARGNRVAGEELAALIARALGR